MDFVLNFQLFWISGGWQHEGSKISALLKHHLFPPFAPLTLKWSQHLLVNGYWAENVHDFFLDLGVNAVGRLQHIT